MGNQTANEVYDSFHLDRENGCIVDQHGALVYESFALNDANLSLRGRVRLAQLTERDLDWEHASEILKFEGFMEPSDFILVQTNKVIFIDTRGPEKDEIGELYDFVGEGFCYVRFLCDGINEHEALPEYYHVVIKIKDIRLVEDFS